MEIDEISAMARRLAVAFNIGSPEVEFGRTSRWSHTGISLRERGGNLVLVIGPPFDALRPAEREAILAEVCAGYKVYPRTFGRLGRALLGHLVVLTLVISLANIPFGVPGWVNILGVGLFPGGWLLIFVLWLRWFSYQSDRAVVEALGRPVIDVALDFDRRHPVKPSVIRWLVPGVAKRRSRLETARGSAAPAT
ncbi:hypothetical protein [Actinomadura sp. 6N118]|uniref:hypothetical protein n=1 Tax=Actinomadura sp. 6N118 TaxID=3375151 RepID=UPI0037AD7CC9